MHDADRWPRPAEVDHPACGCRGIHPGITHEAHMDAYDRRRNEAQITSALAVLTAPGTVTDHMAAWALFDHGVAAEQRRLAAKRAWVRKEAT